MAGQTNRSSIAILGLDTQDWRADLKDIGQEAFNYHPSGRLSLWGTAGEDVLTSSRPNSHGSKVGGICRDPSLPSIGEQNVDREEKRKSQNRSAQRAHRERKDALVSRLERHLSKLRSENAYLREANGYLSSLAGLPHQPGITMESSRVEAFADTQTTGQQCSKSEADEPRSSKQVEHDSQTSSFEDQWPVTNDLYHLRPAHHGIHAGISLLPDNITFPQPQPSSQVSHNLMAKAQGYDQFWATAETSSLLVDFLRKEDDPRFQY